MFAPWQRNVIAIRHGVLLEASGKMKWLANITVLGADPEYGRHHSLFPILADDEYLAAHSAARALATMLYQNEAASVGYVGRIDGGQFQVAIGLTDPTGRIVGRSLEITISKYEGAQ